MVEPFHGYYGDAPPIKQPSGKYRINWWYYENVADQMHYDAGSPAVPCLSLKRRQARIERATAEECVHELRRQQRTLEDRLGQVRKPENLSLADLLAKNTAHKRREANGGAGWVKKTEDINTTTVRRLLKGFGDIPLTTLVGMSRESIERILDRCPGKNCMHATDVPLRDCKTCAGTGRAASCSGKKSGKVLRAALKLAMEEGWIPKAPTFTAPHAPKKRSPINEANQRAILHAVADDPKWLAFYFLALVKGLRLDELLTLRWSNIDPDRKGELDKLMVYGTKTDTSVRPVYLGPEMKHLLATLARAKHPNKNDLIFPGLEGGKLSTNNFGERYWRKLLRSIGLGGKFVFHQTRHTALTRAAECGVPKIVRAKESGHSLDDVEGVHYLGELPVLCRKYALVVEAVAAPLLPQQCRRQMSNGKTEIGAVMYASA